MSRIDVNAIAVEVVLDEEHGVHALVLGELGFTNGLVNDLSVRQRISRFMKQKNANSHPLLLWSFKSQRPQCNYDAVRAIRMYGGPANNDECSLSVNRICGHLPHLVNARGLDTSACPQKWLA
jgi:hypothetical protein